MSTDLVGQYINSIVNGISNTFQLFQQGQYYRAAHSLLPILYFTVCDSQEDQAKVDKVVKSILDIGEDAKQFVSGSTDISREDSYEQARNRLAYSRYLNGVKATKEAIKKSILDQQGRYARGEDLNKLVFEDVEEQ